MQRTTPTIFLAALVASSANAQDVPVFTDANGDGVISAAEVEAARQAFRDALTTRFDTNQDGRLSRDERAAARAARREAKLTEFDTDNDGQLSDAERNAAREARQNAIATQFDVDKDGVISDAEQKGLDAALTRRLGRDSNRRDGKGRKGEHGRQ